MVSPFQHYLLGYTCQEFKQDLNHDDDYDYDYDDDDDDDDLKQGS
jgi:hypothetical protein